MNTLPEYCLGVPSYRYIPNIVLGVEADGE